LTALAIFGGAAGSINAIAGSGSLITFPTLLAAGYDPVVANVSNTLGLVPGSVSGAIGYQRELRGQRHRVRRLGAASVAGGVTGAVLLLVLPGSVFERVVPYLILLACALMAVQPRLQTHVAARGHNGHFLWVGIYATGVYGGYFGAAQGVILMALLSIFHVDQLQRLNALKNVLAGLVNGVAALLFLVFADVALGVSALLAVGSIIGGQVGARYGRRIPDTTLRAAVIVVGLVVAVKLLVAP
jgi:uncharacterized membrane protein YfcA